MYGLYIDKFESEIDNITKRLTEAQNIAESLCRQLDTDFEIGLDHARRLVAAIDIAQALLSDSLVCSLSC